MAMLPLLDTLMGDSVRCSFSSTNFPIIVSTQSYNFDSYTGLAIHSDVALM